MSKKVIKTEEERKQAKANSLANLRPLKKGEERTKRIVAKASKKGVIAKKKIKTLRESLQAILFTELTPNQKAAYRKMGFKVNDDEIATHMDLASARCLAKVISTGDQKAMRDLTVMAGLHIDEKKLTIEGSIDNRPIINLNLGKRPESIDNA